MSALATLRRGARCRRCSKTQNQAALFYYVTFSSSSPCMSWRTAPKDLIHPVSNSFMYSRLKLFHSFLLRHDEKAQAFQELRPRGSSMKNLI